MTARKPNIAWWNKLVAAVRRDPQKAGILVVLVAILVVLQVRLFGARGGPGQATASVAASKSHKPPAPAMSATPINAEGSNPLRAWLDQPSNSVDRNLFVIDFERFPQDAGRPVAATKGSVFWDDLAKSMAQQADVRKERQILVENLQLQASQLRLQSTMMGATPRAVINGEMVKEGDVVANGTAESRTTFRVLKIEARRIIVEREGIKLEIQMK